MTKVISAFPGTGKTYYHSCTQLNVLDSDSSKFSWISEGVRHPDFPDNYMKHIRDSLGEVDIILVSSHIEVRDALVEEGIEHTLVFPDRSLKDEYLERFKNRGSPEKFINLLSKNWHNWINDMEQQAGCEQVRLGKGQYLSDILPK